MEMAMTLNMEEEKKAWEELRYELDKGIRDMEQGRVTSHEETMRLVYEELGLLYV